mmetsp:Transcript_27681/g.39031  ORF Transcript_27681/g.39031 Transcript_27681/m.39031 type:complete len:98 (-) Transcript_27681:198-491(-)|eukprot:CAMPEP_0168543820 /NCGR_PEP_ID=MMETSP0413-20121227/2096_1 /TAXON_ID=136452 /ORGANISM="Filamoeba nolandi, Strain NC-AS-23-1" /LENGTH=97 /DNA_ID=CAMNT_0008573811 /DNA_START=58 /DNA_END=351 /DNA_ORIENTATION=+
MESSEFHFFEVLEVDICNDAILEVAGCGALIVTRRQITNNDSTIRENQSKPYHNHTSEAKKNHAMMAKPRSRSTAFDMVNIETRMNCDLANSAPEIA